MTSKDRKEHAERSWDWAYAEALDGKIDIEKIGRGMEALNTADYLLNHERSLEAEKRIKEIPVDWKSPENMALEAHRNVIIKMLTEIMGDIER